MIHAVAIPVQRAGDFRVYAIAEGTAPTPSDKASVCVRLSEEGDVQLFAQAEFTPIVARARRGASRFRRAAARRASVGKFEAGEQPSRFVGTVKITTLHGPATRADARADAAAFSNLSH